ncbi:hypothetical protein J7E99_21105 [Streptomyces sp. ISL-44]|uniref:hypothetical protein n=1 Tax=Streptomyces sp. ISL-44 TaxID=2819184 RepID=UPI001BE62B9B|nr:hypothetical protein [Streptomyces sp. ISL-44]MBT2543129.1 hypothetical protein [Streptomyces sp. ISL-44]
MDAPDLAAMAVQALSAAASGAANTAATDLVRGRLSRSDRGRAALDELVNAPDDPEASRGVQAALAEEIGGDSEFAGRLAVLLHASSQQHTGSVVLTGSKVTRSQIALGPQGSSPPSSAPSSSVSSGSPEPPAPEPGPATALGAATITVGDAQLVEVYRRAVLFPAGQAVPGTSPVAVLWRGQPVGTGDVAWIPDANTFPEAMSIPMDAEICSPDRAVCFKAFEPYAIGQ